MINLLIASFLVATLTSINAMTTTERVEHWQKTCFSQVGRFFPKPAFTGLSSSVLRRYVEAVNEQGETK